MALISIIAIFFLSSTAVRAALLPRTLMYTSDTSALATTTKTDQMSMTTLISAAVPTALPIIVTRLPRHVDATETVSPPEPTSLYENLELRDNPHKGPLALPPWQPPWYKLCCCDPRDPNEQCDLPKLEIAGHECYPGYHMYKCPWNAPLKCEFATGWWC